MNNILKSIYHQMIVSCQGYDERTFHTCQDMLAMANAAYLGGCSGFRVNSPEYVKEIKSKFPDKPIIGIWKKESANSDVYITPDVKSAFSLVDAGADIVALDCTLRKNYLGEYGWQTIQKIKKINKELILMADCSTYEEAKLAAEAGADIVSTTMSGYTEYSRHLSGPDLEMIKQCKSNLNVFVICEGKIWTKEDALMCFENGADAIVVGTAITNPKMITEHFVNYLKENKICQ
ncbi:MAG: N-acetylmannosamine-6-phosphate 2-epimerase [Erysipelotrichaceae bacterium]|nr:N-acetylmannosamine-6-phosphate 2-epimerase [Erysipelotrichaceae bacterium]MDY5251613.1 N-acetylmannosamine-6-phosphate 2-epimerase [Erysipelotrichaceae bacterium]